MSDFLERLVERSRADTLPEIRPRLPSAFEPGLAAARGSDAPAFDEREEAQPTIHRGPLIPVRIDEPLRREMEWVPAAPRLEPPADPARGAPEPTPRRNAAEPSGLRPVAPPPTSPSRSTPIEPRVARPDPPRGGSRSSRREGMDENEDGDAAPVIRVTIGRIEVRAIAEAPPPAPATRSPAPSLSLDEYLHQRTRGER